MFQIVAKMSVARGAAADCLRLSDSASDYFNYNTIYMFCGFCDVASDAQLDYVSIAELTSMWRLTLNLNTLLFTSFLLLRKISNNNVKLYLFFP